MGGIFGGAPKQQQPQVFQQVDPNAPPPRAPVSTTGFTSNFDAGEAFAFGTPTEAEQFASNFFTASTQGAGGINLPEGLGAGSDRGTQAAFNQLLNTLTTGGAVNEGAQFPGVGFEFLNQSGFPAVENTAGGGLTALQEILRG